jgi:hypothetical protein
VIILPNSFERYLSALRISVSISILKHGLQQRHIDNLRKIHIAESLLFKDRRESADIHKLCTSLLGAVKTIKNGFSFNCQINGNHIINKNLLSLLLLNLAKQKNFLKVSAKKDFLKIRFSDKANHLSHFVKALNGFSLYERKTKQTLIIIPASETNQKSVPIDSEWEYLFDKFSVINLLFNQK